MSRISYRIWFCAVVAIIAAAFANPCIEFASNTGWLGRGDFTDHSNLDVIPTLIIGLALGVAIIMRRIGQLALTGQAGRFAAWLRLSSHVLSPRSIAPLLPVAFAIQMLVLFSMESIEQAIVRGHFLGGLIWMGGPAFASLAAHVFVCMIVAYALVKTLPTFASNAVRIAALILTSRVSARAVAAFRLCADQVTLSRQAPLLCGFGERAPPAPSY